MDDQQLIRTLRCVGMEVFDTFYDQFADESLTNQQIGRIGEGATKLYRRIMSQSRRPRTNDHQKRPRA